MHDEFHQSASTSNWKDARYIERFPQSFQIIQAIFGWEGPQGFWGHSQPVLLTKQENFPPVLLLNTLTHVILKVFFQRKRIDNHFCLFECPLDTETMRYRDRLPNFFENPNLAHYFARWYRDDLFLHHTYIKIDAAGVLNITIGRRRNALNLK